MSLSDLTLEEVNDLLETYKFYSPSWTGYDGTVWPESWYSVRNDNDNDYREGDGWFAWEISSNPEKGENVAGLGLVTCVKQHGGEGQGDDYYIILKVTDGEVSRFFKKPGYHA